jgi:HlyD family secretion protein
VLPPQSPTRTRVLLGDDEPFSLIMLQFFLGRAEDIEVIGCIERAENLLDLAFKLQPDIILFNLEMQDMDELTTIRALVEKLSNTKVLVLSHYKDEEYIHKVLMTGARGYILKGTLAKEIIYTIQCVQKEYFPTCLSSHEKLGESGVLRANETTFLVTRISSEPITTEKYISSREETKALVGGKCNPFLELLTRFRWIILLSAISFILFGWGMIVLRASISKQTTAPSKTASRPMTVHALGRLEPQGEVIRVSAPGSSATSNAGSRVVELLVQEGQHVQKGQVIAVLDSRDRLLASLKEANQQVVISQAKLAQIRAGAKRGEINARKSTVNSLQAELLGETKSRQTDITRLKAELNNTRADSKRYQSLYQAGVVSASEFERYQLAAQTAQEKLNIAQADLNQTQRTLQARIQEANSTVNQVAEVRPTDIALAQAEINGAIAMLNRIEAELAQAYIRSPQNSQILRIYTRAGERVGEKGIVELGQTDPMVAVAEVYESDLSKIRTGQLANITSSTNSFPNSLQGKVTEIGYSVSKLDILDTDPTAANDARVVEVKIQLSPTASRQVARLTNAQVSVEIKL